MDFIVRQKGFWAEDDDSVLKAIHEGYIQTHYAMWKELGIWSDYFKGLTLFPPFCCRKVAQDSKWPTQHSRNHSQHRLHQERQDLCWSRGGQRHCVGDPGRG